MLACRRESLAAARSIRQVLLAAVRTGRRVTVAEMGARGQASPLEVGAISLVLLSGVRAIRCGGDEPKVHDPGRGGERRNTSYDAVCGTSSAADEPKSRQVILVWGWRPAG